MSHKLKLLPALSAAVLALGLTAGCATTDQGGLTATDLEQVREQAAQAQDSANEANAKAEAALNAANEAKDLANRAEGIAKAAQFQAERNERKTEQMFKKSMYK
jgi:murein lipoprotein